jgi:alkylated DNA repair dioxygenase AlkB
MTTTAQQATLFDVPAQLPHGLLYRPRFISAEDEGALLKEIAALPFKEARFHQYTARRRVVRYGEGYDDYEDDDPRLEFPQFLVPLRRRLAELAHVHETEFAHALVTQYQPGTPIGWHRDAPHFAVVAGISLAGSCVMRFRPRGMKPDKKNIVALELEPRSAYVMKGPIRWDWQHSIPPTKALRYSITMRTLVRATRVE